MYQLKKTRSRSKEKEVQRVNQEGKVRQWKAEKEKIRIIVKEKKKKYWKKLCEDNGEKDPWEAVKCAQNLWRIREVMKSLRNVDNVFVNTSKEKTEGRIRDHFI